MNAQSQSSAQHHHVCPWWMAYTFDNPVRKIFHNSHRILSEYIEDGATVMDVGCGMGYFSIGMAKLVGANGKVIAVDLQQKMLNVMLKRAKRAGLEGRIIPHRGGVDTIGIKDPADFILAFWMVHEVNDKNLFFQQLQSILTTKGKILIAEPKMHVTAAELDKTIKIAQQNRLQLSGGPMIRFSRTALLKKR